jgi:hypothetical protein
MTQTEDIKMVVTHDRQERQPITANLAAIGRTRSSFGQFMVS